MDREADVIAKDRILAETKHGEVHFCACFRRMLLRFKGHWMVMRPDEFGRFVENFSRVLRSPCTRHRLS